MKIPAHLLLVPAVAAAAVAAAVAAVAAAVAVPVAARAQEASASSEPQGGLVPLPLHQQGLHRKQAAPAAEFDAAQVAEALGTSDLDAREQSFADLVAAARRNPEARAWLQDTAKGTGELAWTARLALRELERARPRSPFDVWSGANDLDEFEQMLDDFTKRTAPGWNFRLDPFVVPFPGLFGQTPIAPGQSTSRAHRVEIRDTGADGWTIRVTESVDGKESVREYQGKTLEEILEANPELKNEVGVDGALVGPGFSMRIGSPAGETFDFDSLFGNLGVRPGLTPLPAGEEKIRTDVFGVRARPATESEGGQGLYVHSTEPATIANLLGIARGDILLEVNGRELSTLEDVTTALGERGPDGRVEAVWRDGAGRRRTGSWRP